MFSVETKTSFFWTVHGQTRISTSLPSLPGPASESPRSSTTGSDEWLLNIIVLQSLFLVGPSTGKAPVGALRPQMNFLMRLSLGLEIRTHGSERLGRRARDWRSSLRIVEPYWFSMAWSRCKTLLGRKRDGCESLPSRRSCASLLPSIRDCA